MKDQVYLLPHLLAGAMGLGFAWLVSRSDLHVSGVQFVGPAIVILLVHLAILTFSRRLSPGFLPVLFRRANGTALTVLVLLVLGSIFAPAPAQADVPDAVMNILVVVFCAAIIVLIVAMIFLAFLAVAWLYRRWRKSGGDDAGRLHDFGGLALTLAVLGGAALEGTPQGFAFAPQGQASASQYVAAPPAQVWTVMETATSPELSLPAALAFFPQPVAVTVDEGTALGAQRVVAFEGREGAGALSLQVTARGADFVTFTVLSDTTPYAGWIDYTALTYVITGEGAGSRVTLRLDYQRKLAPAWFFGPAMKGAAALAMDVLARDVAQRAAG